MPSFVHKPKQKAFQEPQSKGAGCGAQDQEGKGINLHVPSSFENLLTGKEPLGNLAVGVLHVLVWELGHQRPDAEAANALVTG